MRIFDERNETNALYAISSDSTRTTNSVATDRLVPREAMARVVITTGERLQSRGFPFTIRWTPEQKGIGGNGVADDFAKAAAESAIYATD